MEPLKRNKAGGIILLIIAVFVLPFIFAWFFYKHNDDFSVGTNNYGYLINPPFQLSDFNITTQHPTRFNMLSAEYPTQEFEQVIPGKWILFTINPSRCNEACQKSLYTIRQIRTATNADQNRLVTAVLNLSSQNDPQLAQLLKEKYQGTYNLVTSGQKFQDLAQQYVKHNYALLEGTIYIADPKCNVILVYAPGTNPDYIYKDLHHLLQVSQIG